MVENRRILVVDDSPQLVRILAAGMENDHRDEALRAAMSFAEIRHALCDAFTAAFPGSRGDIVDVYADHVIISDGSGALYEVPYTIDDQGKVSTGDMTKVRRRVDYVAIQSASRLTAATDDANSPDYGYRWRVQIVEAGPDKQGTANYSLDVLKAAAPVYEGTRVFALSQGQHDNPKNPYGKSVRDLVGWLSDVTPNATGLEGTFNILRSSAWLKDMITDAWQRGKKDIVGLSHDVMAKVMPMRGSGPKQVERIVKVDSVDVVYDPIAGGKFLRMAAARTNGKAEKEAEMLEKLLAALKAQRPDLYATIEAKVTNGTVTEDEVIALIASGMTQADLTALVEVIKAATGKPDDRVEQALRESKLLAANLVLKDELKESGLPEISQEKLKKQFTGQIFETETLRAAIKDEKEYLDKITGSGQVTGFGQGRTIVVAEEPEKLQAALDKLFDVAVDDKFKDVQPHEIIPCRIRQVHRRRGSAGHSYQRRHQARHGLHGDDASPGSIRVDHLHLRPGQYPVPQARSGV